MKIHHELEIGDADTGSIPRQCLQALLHKDRLAQWGALFHGLIHNVNGPLQNMTMLTEMLKTSQGRFNQELNRHGGTVDGELLETAQKQEKRLEQMAQQIENLGQMLQDFIALDGMENNDTELDLRILLRRLARAYRADLFCKHHVNIQLELNEEIPLVKIPGRDLIPSLIHLMENSLAALKEAPQKNLRIECRREKDEITILFSDTGCGLPPESTPRDFCTPFAPGPSSPYGRSGKRHRHWGLGLHMVCLLLRPHGVRVALAFDGKETSAILRLPLPS